MFVNKYIILCSTIFSLIAATPVAARTEKCPNPGVFEAADMSVELDEEFLRKMKELGVSTIIRYYDWRTPTLPGKLFTEAEKELIAKHGLSVAIVFQHNSSSPRTYLTPGRGTTDAVRSLELAKDFDQPLGTAIYFGTDGADVNFFEGKGGKQPAGDRYGLGLISDYFRQIKDQFDASGYDVGVYGSGLVCDTLMIKNLVKYCWLANASKWPGTEEFYASKRWSLTQFLPKYCGGKELDFNQVNPDKPNFGQWKP